ncbi:hypothetical protein ACFXHA_16765 [Nocardia sp. NPDC059240]|uniref:hypothetical protein n=1 Tax=Nocardia sp. NPDC059240 TaxID=3346786 RepID=UPI00369EB828
MRFHSTQESTDPKSPRPKRPVLRAALLCTGACALATVSAGQAAAETPHTDSPPTAADIAWVQPTPLRPFAGPVIHLGSAAPVPRIIVTPTPLRPFLGPEIRLIP